MIPVEQNIQGQIKIALARLKDMPCRLRWKVHLYEL